jgi:anti-anti-sigma regulatory factor
MATKENSTGLLSKVAKFVRNPTTNWADLDNMPPETDVGGYSRETLKEMIERKRQNDFVRKREFDHLRKFRNRAPGTSLEAQGRPSFYQSSMSSNIEERAHTLKKIDEIEAQMSKQWWKGKQIEGVAESNDFPVTREDRNTVPNNGAEFVVTQPATALSAADFARAQTAFHRDEANSQNARPIARAPAFDGTGQGFSTSKLFAVELSDETSDPELEEAAIRFANGDSDGAEAGLLDALKSSDGQSEFAEMWVAALFDFYRATGQQGKFDDLALDFAAKVGRSAPAWHSMLAGPADSKAEHENFSAHSISARSIWDSPPSLDLAALGELHLALASAPMPWQIGWFNLEEIQPNALKSMVNLFSTWCNQKVQLHFDGVASLEAVLKRGTVSGNKFVDTNWWRLRMDSLRIMRMQDEFELVALDYCVTYEVSPPSWSDAVCDYLRKGVSAAGSEEVLSTQRHTLTVSSSAQVSDGELARTVPMGAEDVPAVVVELAGEVLGDAADALRQLGEDRHHSGERLVISCARLIRVDFAAAGSILNWVAGLQEEGVHVQFREVHRLVGAFFNVIGINEHARVVLRAN